MQFEDQFNISKNKLRCKLGIMRFQWKKYNYCKVFDAIIRQLLFTVYFAGLQDEDRHYSDGMFCRLPLGSRAGQKSVSRERGPGRYVPRLPGQS